MCHERLGNGSCDAEAHYKAICRALVTEALELSHFLEKVSQGTDKVVRFNGRSLSNKDFVFSDTQNQESHSELAQLYFTIWVIIIIIV